MVRLYTCGWETGDINEWSNALVSNNSGSYSLESTIVRSPGLYSLHFQTVQGGNHLRSFVFNPTAVSEVWIRASVYFSYIGNSDTSFLEVRDATNQRQGYVSLNSLDGLVRAWNGSTLLGTSSFAIALGGWHTIDVHWLITSQTSGTVEVWIDGTQAMLVTGVDNSQQANTGMQSIGLGFSSSSGTQTNHIYYDDIGINDTTGGTNNARIGDGRVLLLMPNGVGSATNLLRGGTDSGANWSQVNEIPPSTAQYVYSGVLGTADSYAVQDIPAGSWQVNSVDVLAFALLSDATGGALGLTLKSGPTPYEGPPQTLTTTAQYFRQHVELDPNINGPWSTAAVNAMEIGTTVR